MFFNADGEEVRQKGDNNNNDGVDGKARIDQLRQQALNKRKNKMTAPNMLRQQTDAPSYQGSAGRMIQKPTIGGSKTDSSDDSRPATAQSQPKKSASVNRNDYNEPQEVGGMIVSDFTEDDLTAEHQTQGRRQQNNQNNQNKQKNQNNQNNQRQQQNESKQGYGGGAGDYDGRAQGFSEGRGPPSRQGSRGGPQTGGFTGGDINTGGGGGYEVENNLQFSSDEEFTRFLTSPVRRRNNHTVIQAYIVRVKNGLRNKMYPVYQMYLTNGEKFMLTAKKRSKNKTSNYMISQDMQGKRESSGYCGKVRANFVGTEFVIYDAGSNPIKLKEDQKKDAEDTIRQELGCVFYEQNILGSKGPRKMTVVIPQIENGKKVREFRPLQEKDGILGEWKAGNKDGLMSMSNKAPKWNEKVNAYVLNFNGRVTLASVKNFQLGSEEDDKVVLQFGRVAKDKFNVDFSWPLSPLQAFSICLSSFDYKFACE